MMAVKKCLATLLVLMLLPWKAEAANPVTCTAVTTRYNTTVVCDFGLDISQSQHGFNVQFYDRDNTDQAKTVLACNFIEDGDLVCHKGSGVRFNKSKVSDQIEVIGLPAVDKVGGRYACQLAPAVGSIKACNLTYKDLPTEPPTTSETHMSESDSIDATSSIVELLRINNGLLIGLYIIIIVAVIVCVLYCIRNRDRGSSPTRPSQENFEATERHESRDARNRRSTLFSSLCGRCYGNKPQEPEAVSLNETNAVTEQPTSATSVEPKWKRLCCSCKASSTGESKKDEMDESPLKGDEKQKPEEPEKAAAAPGDPVEICEEDATG